MSTINQIEDRNTGTVYDIEDKNTSTLVKIQSNVSIETSSWAADSTFADYGYKADINFSGMTDVYVPEVTFNPTDAASGIFAPVASTGTNKVTIYASEVPEGAITILSICCKKEVQ